MRSEEEIKIKIQKIKQDILEAVETGLYTDFLLHENKTWIDALRWVLEEYNQ